MDQQSIQVNILKMFFIQQFMKFNVYYLHAAVLNVCVIVVYQMPSSTAAGDMTEAPDTTDAVPAIAELHVVEVCNVNVNVKQYTLQEKFSEVSVGLCEELGFQPSSELSTTDGW